MVPPDAVHRSASGGYKTLYSFGQDGKSDDGRAPLANLISSGSTLYGTTEYGGTTNSHCHLGCGTIFRITTSGTERVVYRFTGGNDGAEPAGGLIALNGGLLGTTSRGGKGGACSGGCGTVFTLSPDGKSERVLYSFKGGTDGAGPTAGLLSVRGALYGTTQSGGTATRLCSAGCGTIFKVDTAGAESVVYRFKGGSDGAQPVSNLIVLDGMLYGTTEYGGATTPLCATGCGTLFGLTTDGIKKIVHSFTFTPASGDGAYPAAGPTAIGGELYGTTFGGGGMGDGTVFKADPSSGAESVLHSFSCCATSSDGDFPLARLIGVGGVLYGTTQHGGTANSGTAFKITVSGSESVLHSFTGRPDGAQPAASLISLGGTFYGTTAIGGSRSGGTVFALTP